METFIWVGAFLGLVFILIAVIWVVERAKQTHKTIAETAQEGKDKLQQEKDALLAELKRWQERAFAAHPKLGIDSTQFDAGLEKARSLVGEMQAKVGNVDLLLNRLWNAQITPDGKLVLAPVVGGGGVAAPSNVAPNAAVSDPVEWVLPDILIDRDDLMKHITNDFPQPVMLDDVPVHNGLGEPLRYWTWPGKGIRNSQPPGTTTTTAAPAVVGTK